MTDQPFSLSIDQNQAEPVFLLSLAAGAEARLSLAEAIRLSQELAGLAKNTIRTSGTGFVGLFLNDCFTDSSEYLIKSSDFFAFWESYRIKHVYPHISRREFHNLLRAAGVRYMRRSDARYVMLESTFDGGPAQIKQERTSYE